MKHTLSRQLIALAAATIAVSSGIALVATPDASAATVTTAIDTSSAASVRNAYLNVYLPTQNVPTGWTGSVNGCDAGAPSSAAQTAIITSVNYMRAMAGLPSVSEDTDESATTQQAALMLQAADTMSHDRPSTWQCYTPRGASLPSNGFEILAPVSNAKAVPMYMLDPGANNEQMGHRAAVLSAQTTQVGSGSAADYNAMHMLFDRSASASTSYSWPSAGYFPYELATASATRWSYYPQTGTAAGATVTVTKNGTPLAITHTYPVTNAVNAANGTSGLGWDMPTLTAPVSGTTDDYHVTITPATRAATIASYDIKMINALEVSLDAVTIDGTPHVGMPLTAVAHGISPTDATLAYTWSRNGTPIPGATRATYTPTAADLGATLTVTVTGTASGYVSATTTSAPTGTIEPGAVSAGSPTISGTFVVGHTLTADPGTWTPFTTTFTYQWYANGTAIDGANRSTLVLTDAQQGATITVAVKGQASGYASATVTSASMGPVSAPTPAPAPAPQPTSPTGPNKPIAPNKPTAPSKPATATDATATAPSAPTPTHVTASAATGGTVASFANTPAMVLAATTGLAGLALLGGRLRSRRFAHR